MRESSSPSIWKHEPGDHLVPAAKLFKLNEISGRPPWFFKGLSHEPDEALGLISASDYIQVICNIARSPLKDELFSLYRETLPNYSMSGILLALHSAPTLGAGLSFMANHVSISPVFTAKWQAGRGIAKYSVSSGFDLGDAEPFIMEARAFHLANHVRLTRFFDADGLVVKFKHRADRSFSGSMPFDVVFDADEHALVFPETWASEVNPFHDATLWEAGRRKTSSIEAELREANAAGHYHLALLSKLHTRGRLPTLEEFAFDQRVSTRTLLRRLRDAGVTYQALVDSIQKRRALAALGSESATIEVVAQDLGFSDASSFRRSFRRWFGDNPSVWKMRATSDDMNEWEDLRRSCVVYGYSDPPRKWARHRIKLQSS